MQPTPAAPSSMDPPRPAFAMTPEQEWAYLEQGMADAVEPADGGVGIMTDSGPRWYLDRLRADLEARGIRPQRTGDGADRSS